MKSTRTYTMTARAEAAEATRRRILDATVTLAGRMLLAEISLEAVAAEAGVSVQTVLRRFGSREGLFAAAHEHGTTLVTTERETPVGDVDAAVRVVIDHYELRGDAVLMLLAQERTDEAVRQITESGRQLHRRWVEHVFAPYLGVAEERTSLVDLLVVATDLYTWKLLRRDRGLSPTTTHTLMTRLVRAVLSGR